MVKVLRVLALLAALTASCWGPTYVVQQYSGPARPPETIATLRVNGSEAVRILVLDVEDVAAPVASDARLHFEMVPGRHRLRVANANAPNEPAEALAFEGEAGKVYRVIYGSAGGPRVFEVDRGSDKPLRDVTLPPEAMFDREPRERPRRPAPAPPAPSPAGPETTPETIESPDAGG